MTQASGDILKYFVSYAFKIHQITFMVESKYLNLRYILLEMMLVLHLHSLPLPWSI